MEGERNGIKFGDGVGYCISNLRFADDVLLLSTSLNQLKTMMTDFKRSTRLKRKSSPTKNQTKKRSASRQHHNGDTSPKRKSEVSWTSNYFSATRTIEIKSSIRAAWPFFARYRQEMTSRSHLLWCRLRLLDAMMTPTMM